ncbi:neuronal acetylcholine receptor subunit alpha-10-like [Pecten maximus]|uniref:neuronal acetylcholine receptor subunit alpha-10-like n=1 Tax=Pecten maximus TaxID=6579 RepID=UPI001458105D|nr:neuronal acetylcholine receptor subunit alpha-10-like [Pecten maximus]
MLVRIWSLMVLTAGIAWYLLQLVEADCPILTKTVNVSSEQRLMLYLMAGYEKSIRPVYNSSSPVEVKLGLTLTQILDLDEKNQILTTNVWMEVEWYDEKLSWDYADYGGLTSIRIPCNRIWLPDVVLYNSVDDYTSGYMPSLAMVHNDSRVFWGPVVRFRSSCKIDITFFPFDDQMCKLKLGSWAYHGFQVNVFNRSTTIDLSNFVDNGEWELVENKVERNQVYYNCCSEPFPDVTFYIYLRRRIKYYFMNIIIPCIILSFLCLAGFLLPPESGEKITLGLSVLLTITVFMLMVADKMPQTSESISVISIYLMVVLSMSCMSVLTSVWILSIHHQRGKPKRVPTWLRVVVLTFVAKCLCVNIRLFGTKDRILDYRNRKKNKNKKIRVAMEDPEIIRMDANVRDHFDIENSMSTIENNIYRESYLEREDAIKELIDLLQTRHLEELYEEEVYKEWRDVAFVLDRMFFVLFLLITTIATVCILEMRPSPGKH